MIPRLAAILGLLAIAQACASPKSLTPFVTRTIVVLCSGLTAEDLASDRYPTLCDAARRGQVGLMTAVVAGEHTDAAAALTIALGMQAPAGPHDAEAYLARSERVEGDAAGVVYTRRTGTPVRSGGPAAPGIEPVVHVGWGSLVRRGLAASTLGAALARAGWPLAVGGNADGAAVDRSGALLAVDGSGQAPPGPLAHTDPAALAAWALRQPGSVVVQFPRRATGRVNAFLAFVQRGRPEDVPPPRILLISPAPLPEAGGRWSHLAPVMLLEDGARPGVLTSGATHTRGVIANTDIAPSLLAWVTVDPPTTMRGRVITSEPDDHAVDAIVRLDRVTRLCDRSMAPTFWSLGAIVALVGFGGLGAAWRGRGSARAFGLPLLVMLNMPTGLLLASGSLTAGLPVTSVWWFTALVLGLMAACAGAVSAMAALLSTRDAAVADAPTPGATPLEDPGAHRRARHRVLLSLALMWLAIVADTAAGQPMQRFSLLSAFLPQAIRYYGVGNEYMGILIGSLATWVFVARTPRAAAGWLMAAAAVIVGFPRLGANAGGFIACVAAFGAAWDTLCGRPACGRRFAAWCAVGFAGALVMAWIDAATAASAPTHMGAALQGAHTGGPGALVDIAVRKALMNARVTMHPGNLCAIAGYALILWLLRSPLRAQVASVSAREPGIPRAAPAVVCGSLAAFLFNDSGIVAAILLTGVYLAVGVILLFAADPAQHPAHPRDRA